MENTPKIVCPVCGQEYQPVEVFIPDDFFGKPKDIIKKDNGKIDFITGTDMNMSESFVCENCGAHLKIDARLYFDIKVDDTNDFSKNYTTKINKPDKLKLKESNLFNDNN